MTLPSGLLVPTTEATGYFEYPTADFASWLVTVLGSAWSQESISEPSITLLLERIRPAPQPALNVRYLILNVDGWTAVLNDAPGGTDLGVLPSRAAQGIGCRAVRAVASEASPNRFAATILEVYDPTAVDEPSRCRRSLFAADDGGTWRFGQFGEPFSFESVDAYSRPRIQDRFTKDMLEHYLLALGVPANSEPLSSSAFLVAAS